MCSWESDPPANSSELLSDSQSPAQCSFAESELVFLPGINLLLQLEDYLQLCSWLVCSNIQDSALHQVAASSPGEGGGDKRGGVSADERQWHRCPPSLPVGFTAPARKCHVQHLVWSRRASSLLFITFIMQQLKLNFSCRWRSFEYRWV